MTAYWQIKSRLFSAEKWEEKRYFLFVFHIEWLNFTLHWRIWGDAPWNQSNSGISEEQYFETSGDMWPYYFLHLRTDYTIMWQSQRWNCGDSLFPTLVNWFLTALWTETVEQITNDSTKSINSFCNRLIFSWCNLRAENKLLSLGFALIIIISQVFKKVYSWRVSKVLHDLYICFFHNLQNC